MGAALGGFMTGIGQGMADQRKKSQQYDFQNAIMDAIKKQSQGTYGGISGMGVWPGQMPQRPNLLSRIFNPTPPVPTQANQQVPMPSVSPWVDWMP